MKRLSHVTGKTDSGYSTEGLLEARFEPGSRNRVLRNLLGVRRRREMDRLEARELLRATEELAGQYDRDHRFTAGDLCHMHDVWLGGIYEWAGRYRSVNVGKGGFMFAAAARVPALMDELEAGPLTEHTPCRFDTDQEVARAVAVVHVEFVLIHPFREGNGRLARLLATLMALQADLPPLDFGAIRGRKRQEYFAAVRSGLDREYEPMERIFTGVIGRTRRRSDAG